jgi:hypothetical protein
MMSIQLLFTRFSKTTEPSSGPSKIPKTTLQSRLRRRRNRSLQLHPLRKRRRKEKREKEEGKQLKCHLRKWKKKRRKYSSHQLIESFTTTSMLTTAKTPFYWLSWLKFL